DLTAWLAATYSEGVGRFDPTEPLYFELKDQRFGDGLDFNLSILDVDEPRNVVNAQIGFDYRNEYEIPELQTHLYSKEDIADSKTRLISDKQLILPSDLTDNEHITTYWFRRGVTYLRYNEDETLAVGNSDGKYYRLNGTFTHSNISAGGCNHNGS